MKWKGILVGIVLVCLLIFGGPVIGVVVSSTTFMIPVLFILALIAFAGWKIADLVRR